MDIVKTETHCEPNLIGRSLTKGLSAAKEYRVAGTVLWLFGCVLVFGYYFVPTLHHTLEQLGNLKRQSDFVFASVSTGLFGGFLPSLIIKLASKSSSTRHYLFSNSLFWAIKGAEIEILYQLQARAFGDQADWSVVALKTCFDQFIYVPTIGIVNVVLFYVWRESRYNCAVFRKRLGLATWTRP